ncbi:MAG: efflux RND transporter periplasmic adaptor subunit [Arenicella sp.]
MKQKSASITLQCLMMNSLLFTASHTFANDASQNDFQCLMIAETEVSISPPVSGVIKQVYVERGDNIKKNQVLVRLKAEVEQAEADLTRARRAFSQRKLQRNKQLFKDSIVSEVAVDEAETEAKLVEVEVRKAEALLVQKTIRSPISGIVISRSVSDGQFVNTEEMVKIAKIDPLFVEVVLPVSEFGKVAVGAQATVFPESPVNGEYQAKVVVVDPVIDAASGTFGIRLELPNPKNTLPAGLNCRVKF